MTRVKVCGITSVQDARWAAECGTDAIGLIFIESPRQVDVARALEIVAALPPYTTPVGLFAEVSDEEIAETASEVGLRVVQIHGAFPPEAALAVAVGSVEDIREMRGYPAEAFLLDAKAEGKHGGTGKTFDWSLAREAKELGAVILAGGLGPDNVAEAIRQVKPYAVDASSRLEAKPRVKDPELVRRFVEAAKQAGG